MILLTQAGQVTEYKVKKPDHKLQINQRSEISNPNFWYLVFDEFVILRCTSGRLRIYTSGEDNHCQIKQEQIDGEKGIQKIMIDTNH